MHRPVREEIHLSAVAVDYGVAALQGAVLGVWVLSCGIRLTHIYNINQSVGQFSTFFEFFNHLMERH